MTMVVLAGVVVAMAACAPEPEPAFDEASVIVNNASVRADAASASRTLFRLPEGERVSVIERVGTWYRVRDRDDFEGWMEESTVLLDSTLETMTARLAASEGQQVQNTVTTLAEVNLRLEPGRDTAIVRRLRRNLTLEVLDRATTPRPNSDQTDIWFLVRTSGSSEVEIGWVYAQLVEFDVPEDLAPFTEGRIYAAIQVLSEVVDEEVGPVRWYLVAERRPEAEPGLAFDGIRVFTWNMSRHQRATSLRLRDLRGAYPVEITDAGFRFHVLDASGDRVPREFAMRGTIPREVTPSGP